LPVKSDIVCQPQTRETPTAPAVNPNSAISSSSQGAAEEQDTTQLPPAAFEAIDTVCPCLGEVLVRWWQAVLHGDSRRQSACPAPSTEAECPYLRQQATDIQAAATGSAARPVSVLDNLEKLDKAHEAYNEAEYHRRQGRLDTACDLYERVLQLCPGSRFDRMAADRLAELRALAPAARDATASEEQSDPPPRQSSEGGSKKPLQRHEVPTPLPVPLQSSLLESIPATLPPIDPKLVAALERLLVSAGEPDLPKLILQEGPNQSAAEHDDDARLGWSIPISVPDQSTILLLPAVAPPVLDEQGSADDEQDDAYLAISVIRDWNDVLRATVDGLATAAYLDVDSSRLARLRMVGEKQIGIVQVRVFSDEDDVWRAVVATLLPEGSGDPRAIQRAYNDRILHWIQTLGASSYDADWDDFDDWDDDLDDDGDLSIF
jgi:hypothetical protein